MRKNAVVSDVRSEIAKAWGGVADGAEKVAGMHFGPTDDWTWATAAAMPTKKVTRLRARRESELVRLASSVIPVLWDTVGLSLTGSNAPAMRTDRLWSDDYVMFTSVVDGDPPACMGVALTAAGGAVVHVGAGVDADPVAVCAAGVWAVTQFAEHQDQTWVSMIVTPWDDSDATQPLHPSGMQFGSFQAVLDAVVAARAADDGTPSVSGSVAGEQ